ncbi:hypothetical protein [Branchiibius hedensis]|uniref:hypothetical protein n=1 Tax=Branchiibius hedensis TaxID=672460 RepID=UPI0011B21ADD|nr:hypothetical protein [Branchiibius hedensis]
MRRYLHGTVNATSVDKPRWRDPARINGARSFHVSIRPGVMTFSSPIIRATRWQYLTARTLHPSTEARVSGRTMQRRPVSGSAYAERTVRYRISSSLETVPARRYASQATTIGTTRDSQ